MGLSILAIESSCDDTAAAVITDGKVRSNVIAGQAVHRQYGGVVPELASRTHQANIIPVVDAAIKESGVSPEDLSAIAFTRGPGLMGSLMVGVAFAKGLAMSLKIPLIEVNHLHAHVMAHFAETPVPAFPFLCLLVSGGHTQFLRVSSPLAVEVLGSTTDDAAGEAFDKAGKILGLGYPAGPEIDDLAEQGQPRFSLPHPQISGYDTSFSGLKTAFLYFVRKEMERDPQFIGSNLVDLCASVRFHIVEILMEKLILCARETGMDRIAIAGGVSANVLLRRRLQEEGRLRNWKTFIPPLSLSTDNAAMIGLAGYYKYLSGEFTGLDVRPEARLPL